MIRLFQGDNKGGLADYDKALQYDPLDVYSWNNRAQAKVGLGDKKDAIADFRKALELRPDHGSAREGMQRLVAREGAGRLRRIIRRAEENPGRSALRAGRGRPNFRARHTPRSGRTVVGLECRGSRLPTYASFQGRFTMSDFRFFSRHRPWEDWFGMLLGVLIVVSPWFPFQTHDIVDNERSIMILNTFVIGMLVFGLAQLEYVALQRWEEVGAIVLGCWLIASPFLFGYSGDTMLQIWHAVLGGLVVLLGALQLWQDWGLSDQDLANHAQ